MKYIYVLSLGVIVLLSGCMTSPSDSEKLPEDVGELRTVQKQTRSEIEQLNRKLKRIEEKLAEIDTAAVRSNGKLVTLDTVDRSDFKHFISIQSAVESDHMVNVSAEISGRLMELYYEEGDHVKKGQLVARLDAESMRKQLEELKTSLELAKEVYQRQSNLWDQEIGTEIQYLRAKNEKERLEKQIATLEHRLTKSRLYAPMSGVVEATHFESGELISPGMPVLTILDLDRMKVVADVPENYLGAVRKGDEVRLEFPALDTFRVEEVSRVGSTIHPTNRTFAVEVKTDNSDGLLKPNLTGQMKIQDLERKEVIVIPTNLVQHEVSGKSYVFLMEETEKGMQAVKRYVRTGPSYEGEVVIKMGLTPGEILIRKGARTLNEGKVVRIEGGKNK